LTEIGAISRDLGPLSRDSFAKLLTGTSRSVG
jgi:hypothetical protein